MSSIRQCKFKRKQIVTENNPFKKCIFSVMVTWEHLSFWQAFFRLFLSNENSKAFFNFLCYKYFKNTLPDRLKIEFEKNA